MEIMLSMFYLIIKKGDMTFLSELMKKGTDLNGLNKQGQTPLYLAILNGDKNTVEVLIKK